MRRGRHSPRRISIHAAREGGDRSAVDDLGRILISIHAAREGGDISQEPNAASRTNFNPRRP